MNGNHPSWGHFWTNETRESSKWEKRASKRPKSWSFTKKFHEKGRLINTWPMGKTSFFEVHLTSYHFKQFPKNSGALNRLLFEDHRSDPRSKPVDHVFPLADCPRLCSWIWAFKLFQKPGRCEPHLAASKELYKCGHHKYDTYIHRNIIHRIFIVCYMLHTVCLKET